MSGNIQRPRRRRRSRSRSRSRSQPASRPPTHTHPPNPATINDCGLTARIRQPPAHPLARATRPAVRRRTHAATWSPRPAHSCCIQRSLEPIFARIARQRRTRADNCCSGQRSQDPPYLLQGQGLQEAHPAQGHPLVIHSRGPDAHTESAQSTRLARLLCSPRVSAVTTVSSPVTEVRPSPSSTRGPRPPRRLSSDWSAQLARPRHRYDHCAPHLHTHG